MIDQLIYLLIIAVVIGTIWFVVDYIPVPEPLNRIIKVVSMVIGAIAVIMIMLRLIGVTVAI